MASNILSKFLRLLFENSCLVCNTSSQDLLVCNSCNRELNQKSKSYMRNLPKISVYSWGFYDGKLRTSILSFKNGSKDLSFYFANVLANYWQTVNGKNLNHNTIVVPVPSHPQRIKERGYCHTTLLASNFAKKLSLEFSNKLIVRKKHTQHMNTLKSASARYKNVEEAFYLTNKPQDNTKLLIIDDILTSGATLQEIARVLSTNCPLLNMRGLTIACGDKYS